MKYPKNFHKSIHDNHWIRFSIIKEFVSGIPSKEGRKAHIFQVESESKRRLNFLSNVANDLNLWKDVFCETAVKVSMIPQKNREKF